MKFFATIIFSITLFTLSAQSASYSVECLRPDSCFLKEVSIAAATEQDPRPQSVTSYKLFRSLSEFDGIVSNIRSASAKKMEEGMKLVDEARAINAIADKIAAAKPKQ